MAIYSGFSHKNGDFPVRYVKLPVKLPEASLQDIHMAFCEASDQIPAHGTMINSPLCIHDTS